MKMRERAKNPLELILQSARSHASKTAKAKAKKVLNIDSSSRDLTPETPIEAAYEELNESPAFNSSRFFNKARIGPAGIPNKAIAFVQGTADALINPKQAIKRYATRTAAGKLAKSNPCLSRKADLEFLAAHDDLSRIQGAECGEQVDKRRHNISDCQDHVKDMERKRQSMRVALITARHVQRVRTVNAIPPPFPEDSFERQDDCGYTEFQWGKYIAYRLLNITHQFTAQYIDDLEELPFDSDTLRRYVERFIMVSAPLQTFISDIRRIYRWEAPAGTGRWMALYFYLWYISHITSFFYGCIFYSTVMNFFYPSSLEDLRQGIERSIDRGAKALKVGEMIDKHGSNDWLGPLLEELGPVIQVHVADFADLLEAYYNFYHFHNPYATVCSLFFVLALFSVSVFGSTEFAMKIWWLVVGFTFFVCFPISSHWPRYRLLIAPWKWTIWDVPTHTEWCFQYLQERAAVAKQSIFSASEDDNHYIRRGKLEPEVGERDEVSDTDSFMSAVPFPLDQERDILSFGCTFLHPPGRLVISTTSLRFESSLAKALPYEAFDKSYTELMEMSKRQTHTSILKPLAKLTTGLDKIELVFRDEDGGAGMHYMREKDHAQKMVLENMRDKDKAFNAIIEFSGVRWQCLQQKGEKRKKITLDGDMKLE